MGSPDCRRALGPLFAEIHLQIANARGHKLAVIIEVEESLASRLLLIAGQMGQLVIAVEMHLVGVPVYIPPLESMCEILAVWPRGPRFLPPAICYFCSTPQAGAARGRVR